MASIPSSLPIVMIFERHWDKEPKQLLKTLIPEFSKAGYNTLCFEAPQDWEEKELRASYEFGLKKDLEIYSQAKPYLKRAKQPTDLSVLSEIGYGKLMDMMQLYVSSKRYAEIAEKIKQLPATMILKDIFKSVKDHGLKIQGIDLSEDDYMQMMIDDSSKRIQMIDKLDDVRITTFTNQLLKLHRAGKGIVFPCGASHADKLISKLKQEKMDNILYYFPHSGLRFDESIDDLNEFYNKGILKNHRYSLMNDSARKSLAEKIIKEIKGKEDLFKEKMLKDTFKHASNLFNQKKISEVFEKQQKLPALEMCFLNSTYFNISGTNQLCLPR